MHDVNSDHININDQLVLNNIEGITDNTFTECADDCLKGSKNYRLQQGEHGGSHVFFNLDGRDTRFGLTHGRHGTMYLAADPLTAIKEVFQNKLGIRESDLNHYYMGTVVLEKDLRVINLPALITMTPLTLNNVTSSSRHVTQTLAAKVYAAGFDGIRYPSNVTTQGCLATWYNDPRGAGVARTETQICLSEFMYQGNHAADILVEVLGIPVEE